LKDHHWRDALAALSLANFSLLGIWNALLNTPPDQTFFLRYAPQPAQFAAALANALLLGLFFLIVIRIARRAHYRYGVVASAPILLLMALPAAGALIRLMAPTIPKLGIAGSAALLAILVCATAFFARGKTYAVGAAVLVTLSPLIIIEAVLSIVSCRSDRAMQYADGALAPRVPHSIRPRVVWIVFDELDYRLTFLDRAVNLDLPNFDRVRAESIFAENATPPANNTLHSIPSLLTGVKLASIETLDTIHATASGAPLTSLPTIFSAVHGMGENAAVAGWYLPYCRLFSADLAACSCHDGENSVSDSRGTFAESLAFEGQSLFEYGYGSVFRQSPRARHRARMVQEIIEESRRYASDPSLDFVFLHLPAPHAPHFYDRLSATFTRRVAGPTHYPDSLALADRMLGDIRDAMTSTGLWSTTTVLVSSDHHNRASTEVDGKTDPRVPFLLKLARQTASVSFAPPLHTIVTRPLVEAILRGQIESQEQSVRWLQAH
jgi:hypothetical protein